MRIPLLIKGCYVSIGVDQMEKSFALAPAGKRVMDWNLAGDL